MIKKIVLMVLCSSSVFASTFYVDINSPNPTPPYDTLYTASVSIQPAVDQAVAGDTIIVTNGLYEIDTEIFINKAVTIQSVNGPEGTIVKGTQHGSCFNLENYATTVRGFTIHNGSGNNGSHKAGGGIYCSSNSPVVINCIIRNNYGGGMNHGTAINCHFHRNSSRGMSYGIAINCTFTKNSGGMYYGTAKNCIAWNNSPYGQGDNFYSTTASYCCSPDVIHEVDGNITNNPALFSPYHIREDSPCRGAGNTSYSDGFDLDGQPWLTPPSIGCDEYYEFDERPIYVAETGDDALDGRSWTTAKSTIQAGVNAQMFPVGQVIVSNGTYISDAEITIIKPITVTSVNGFEETIVDGNQKGTCFNLGNFGATIIGVTIQNGSGFISDYGRHGGGVYCSGNTPSVSNCLFYNNFSGDDGGGMYQGFATFCTFTNNSTYWADGGGMYSGIANNCFFNNNSTSQGRGGGKVAGVANNCTFYGNSARYGGGMYDGYATNCIFIKNVADIDGAGMLYGLPSNCTFTENVAGNNGGGIYYGNVKNCIIWNNTASGSGNDFYESTLYYSCASDAITNDGNHNISLDPLFIDASAGDFHLQTNSPCIDSGFNDFAPSEIDLDGLPRIANGIVDMGAYEYHLKNYYFITASASGKGAVSPSGVVSAVEGTSITFTIIPNSYYDTADVLTNDVSLGLAGVTSYTWENITSDGSLDVTFEARTATNNVPEWWLAYYGWTDSFNEAALSDTDGDGYEAWREYTLGTDPTDHASSLNFRAHLNGDAYRLQFDGVLERFYTVEFSYSLTADDWREYFSLGNVNGPFYFSDYNISSNRFYRMKVDWLE